MMQAPAPSSPARGIRPGPFISAASAIYLLSFASQVLLSPPVTSHLNVAPFALAQTVLIALWIVLHRRRLIDARQPTSMVIAVALIYILEVLLLIIVVALMLASTTGSPEGVGPGASILQLFVILYLLTLLSSDPSLGGVQIWIFVFVGLMALPVLIAIAFSIWAATRSKTEEIVWT